MNCDININDCLRQTVHCAENPIVAAVYRAQYSRKFLTHTKSRVEMLLDLWPVRR